MAAHPLTATDRAEGRGKTLVKSVAFSASSAAKKLVCVAPGHSAVTLTPVPANSVATRLFGQDITDNLVSALWGEHRVLPRAGL